MGLLPVTTDDRLIWDTWLAMYRLPVLTVADEVGTFSSLTERALTTSELAQSINVDARAVGIHLGMLASLGFVERREGRWRATACRAYLVASRRRGIRRAAPAPVSGEPAAACAIARYAETRREGHTPWLFRGRVGARRDAAGSRADDHCFHERAQPSGSKRCRASAAVCGCGTCARCRWRIGRVCN